MLTKIVLRPKRFAGVDREAEEQMVRWEDGTGMVNTLDEGELRHARASTPDLDPGPSPDPNPCTRPTDPYPCTCACACACACA